MQQMPPGHQPLNPPNPYAPPIAAGQSPVRVGAGAPLDWELGEVLSQAFDILKRYPVPLIVAPFLAQLISQALGFSVELVKLVVDDTTVLGILGLGIALAQVAVGTFFAVGLTRLFVAAARGQEPEFGALFSGDGRTMLLLLLTQLLVGLAVIIGTALLIVPGVIAALGLAFALYYCVDLGEGPVEAVKRSWEATSGQKMKLFVFALACIGVLLAGLFACLVGLLVAYPLVMLAAAIIYTRISGTAGSPQFGAR